MHPRLHLTQEACTEAGIPTEPPGRLPGCADWPRPTATCAHEAQQKPRSRLTGQRYKGVHPQRRTPAPQPRCVVDMYLESMGKVLLRTYRYMLLCRAATPLLGRNPLQTDGQPTPLGEFDPLLLRFQCHALPTARPRQPRRHASQKKSFVFARSLSGSPIAASGSVVDAPGLATFGSTSNRHPASLRLHCG